MVTKWHDVKRSDGESLKQGDLVWLHYEVAASIEELDARNLIDESWQRGPVLLELGSNEAWDPVERALYGMTVNGTRRVVVTDNEEQLVIDLYVVRAERGDRASVRQRYFQILSLPFLQLEGDINSSISMTNCIQLSNILSKPWQEGNGRLVFRLRKEEADPLELLSSELFARRSIAYVPEITADPQRGWVQIRMINETHAALLSHLSQLISRDPDNHP
jgi:hypothetical protein